MSRHSPCLRVLTRGLLSKWSKLATVHLLKVMSRILVYYANKADHIFFYLINITQKSGIAALGPEFNSGLTRSSPSVEHPYATVVKLP